MMFIVDFQQQAGARNKALEAFERQGPNRNSGVKFEAAWIGRDSDVAFALVDAADEAQVATAADTWSELSSAKIHAVVDV